MLAQNLIFQQQMRQVAVVVFLVHLQQVVHEVLARPVAKQRHVLVPLPQLQQHRFQVVRKPVLGLEQKNKPCFSASTVGIGITSQFEITCKLLTRFSTSHGCMPAIL